MDLQTLLRLPRRAEQIIKHRFLGREHYIVFRDMPLVYGRVPKAANSTIKIMLARMLAERQKHVLSDEFWRERTDGQTHMLRTGEAAGLPAGPVVFTFVRNPESRLASFYDNKVADPDSVLPQSSQRMGIAKGDSFERVVEIVCDTPTNRMDVHVLPQTDILVHDGRIVPGFVGRVETMRADWDRLRALVQAQGGRDLGELGPRKKGRKRNLDDYYTDRLRAAVRRKYQDDYRWFYPEQL
jgi:dermatan 4-sulfotransferase 1